MILPVILAGGFGARLWPLSRAHYPKQFLTLQGKQSMLQSTLARLQGLEHHPSLVVCNEEHRFIVAEQLRQIGIAASGIILEPVARNSAPAITLAAMVAQGMASSIDELDPVLLVLPADHVIEDESAFIKSLLLAKNFAEQGKLVTFGVRADSAHTGYGYIRKGAEKTHGGPVDGMAGFDVSAFVEKPDKSTALKYVESGGFLWNSGMFMFKVSCYLEAIQAHSLPIHIACQMAMDGRKDDADFIRIDKQSFIACPQNSIDYAVMEPMCEQGQEKVIVVPLDAGWNDIGGFLSLWEMADKDGNGNVLKGDVKVFSTANSLVISHDKLVTTLGVDDLIIVSTKDAVLVAHKNHAQEVKELVADLIKQQRSEALSHTEVYRPWGKYDLLDSGERFKVKRITVAPGNKLSLQMHYHRAEHWVVVAGTAKITNGDTVVILRENESAFIPQGTIHMLENPGLVDLEVIEVQSGAYLEEDDIVRFADDYDRQLDQ